MSITRRGFMMGCSSAIAAMTGGRLGMVAFGAMEDEPTQEILVSVFLRGGMDGLSVVAPIAGVDRGYYESARPELRLPLTGESAAINLNGQLGLHGSAAPLFDLYQAGKLAVIHAAGLTSDTRSHFDAMEFMERGTPDNKSTTTGWLTRHLQSAGDIPAEVILPALATGNLAPSSLLGSIETIGMTSPDSFTFHGHWYYRNLQRMALRKLYGGPSWLHQAGIQTLNAVDIIEGSNTDNYTPANGAVYPGGSFGNNLRSVAQIIKLQLGLRVATVDLGGWDTHEYQGGNGGGYFAGLLGQLAQGLNAFYTDLDGAGTLNYNQRVTVVVMSEFGRRLRENGSGGTDHGHGNVMFVLGGNVNGGQVHGVWPGLHNDQLYDHADLSITTDYRRVLSEILIRRLGNANLGTVFPGYAGYSPLGVVGGTDLPPIYTTPTPTPLPTATPTRTPTPTATPPTKPGEERRVFLPNVQR